MSDAAIALKAGRQLSLKFKKPDRLTLAVAFLFSIIAMGIFAPFVAPYDPNYVNLMVRMAPPVWMEGGSWAHIFGTDQLGRDLLSRCIYGIRNSFAIASVGIIVSSVVGIGLGIVAGLAGKWADRIIMMIVDAFIALPNMLLMLCGIAILGRELWVLVLMIGLVKWEGYSRIIRGQVLQIKAQGYIESCQVLGGNRYRIAIKHVVPNLVSPIAVMLTLSFPSILTMEAGLSFLGVGIQPPTASIGRMIDEGRDYLIDAWWITGIPAAVIVTITLTFQIIGDLIRDKVDAYTNE